MKTLKEVVLYFCEGKSEIPTISYFDDKNASDEEKAKDKAISDRIGAIRTSKIDADIENHLSKAEQGKRSLCFYPNGHKNMSQIEEIKWHFVDIDHGDKGEQFKRIMSAPLKPTLVWRGRAGHKFLYRVTDALWDKTTKESLDASINHFKNIQQQLIEYFDSDGALTTPSYPLRLPFTKNYKYWREEVVEETIVFFDPNNECSQQELSNAFPLAEEKHEVSETVTFEGYPNEVREILETILFYFQANDIEYIDRGDRLSFQCPVHEDSSPSAYMYKADLVCHCSKGAADGSCEIGKGKSLGWVADHLGWDDLKVHCDNLASLGERKYLNIDLNEMLAKNLIPVNECLDEHMRNLINPIVLSIEEVMDSRGIQLDIQTRLVYEGVLNKLLSNQNAITVCPLEPGGGKSTLMEAYLKCMLENYISKAGTVVVVERIETAKKLAEQLGIYRTYLEDFDAPCWMPNKSAYVMESAFTYKKCKKKLTTYEYGICRGCSERMTCPISQKYIEQKKHPIVIMTHARLKMEADKLDKYSKWENIDGEEYERNLIIIDEKPPLIEVDSLKLKDFDQFLTEVYSMGLDIEDAELEVAKGIIKQLREQVLTLQNGGGILKPVNPSFSFGFTATWYKKYNGNDVDLIRRIEFLIQKGGRVHLDQKREINVYITRVNKYSLDHFNTVILDGTSIIDMDYNVLGDFEMIDVPRIKSYEKLMFHIDSTQSLSKSKLNKNPILIEQVANNIQTLTESDKSLVLCYKNSKGQLSHLLKDEVKCGKALINHYGNVKGSNNYADCTVLVMTGVPHKGDPYYISKCEAIFGKILNQKTITYNHVRRFQDPKLEMIKLNDQLVDAIQDILRIKIRNKDNTKAIKVFIPTKDQVFKNLLIEYFEGAATQKWLINETYPYWYEPLKELFFQLKVGQKIRKSEIKEHLSLAGDAGKKAFQRIQKNPSFKGLIASLGIKEFNSRTYIQENLESAVRD